MDLIHPVPLPQLFVLWTGTTMPGEGTAFRTHLYFDADVAARAGRQAVADKPQEAVSVAFRVLPLEGPR